MTIHRLSHIARLSLGLVMLTSSILLMSEIFGLLPEQDHGTAQVRKLLSESLAVQLSTTLSENPQAPVGAVLQTAVRRNPMIIAAALRKKDGELLFATEEHLNKWQLPPGEPSTLNQIRVPVYHHDQPWGELELVFQPVNPGIGDLLHNPLIKIVLFAALAGFVAYLVYLKRALKELNPDAVIPERVRKALDTLAEGLLILDRKENIVFANSVFAKKTGLSAQALIGKKCRQLGWEVDAGENDVTEFPWTRVLRGEEQNKPVQLVLATGRQRAYTFAVKASPIYGTANEIRGALVTFDDVTELLAKNQALEKANQRLEQSQREISRQNQELQLLATRDPLTNCLNRRALFAGFQTLFDEALKHEEELGCIMVDIDHFKSINDRFGHAVGDKVIQLVAQVITKTVRTHDLVGRYGGEEFCVVLPDTDAATAAEVAERIRLTLAEGKELELASAIRITASLGVSSLASGAKTPQELVDQADMALYAAKEGGRNRVIQWASLEKESENPAAPSPPAMVQSQPSAPRRPEPVDEQQPGILHQRIQELEQALVEQRENPAAKLFFDESIGLPNKLLMFDRMQQAIERARRFENQFAVLILDFSRRQQVDDIINLEDAGKLFKTISIKLKRILRTTDTIAVVEGQDPTYSVSRINNDKYAVLLTDLSQIESVSRVVERITEGFDEPLTIDGMAIRLSVNIGISLYPGDGRSAEALVNRAVNALQEARQLPGRHNHRFYSEEIDKKLKYQAQLTRELFKADERGELLLYYQPKISLKTGRISGMEALVRWQHPRLGLVPPDQFISLAERNGIIDKIGNWVIRTACRQAALWREQGFGNVPIAVNLSPVQFQNEDFAEQLLQVVAESGGLPKFLELEITEGVVMQNVDRAVKIMNTLSRSGIRIALDDFGTGYSSLSCLKRFPIDNLKIDRSFLTDITENPADAALVSSIIAMAHGMNLSVTAEGVENETQLRFLHDLQCNEIQGYYISKPLPPEEADQLLETEHGIRRKIQTILTDPDRDARFLATSSASTMETILNHPPRQYSKIT